MGNKNYLITVEETISECIANWSFINPDGYMTNYHILDDKSKENFARFKRAISDMEDIISEQGKELERLEYEQWDEPSRLPSFLQRLKYLFLGRF